MSGSGGVPTAPNTTTGTPAAQRDLLSLSPYTSSLAVTAVVRSQVQSIGASPLTPNGTVKGATSDKYIVARAAVAVVVTTGLVTGLWSMFLVQQLLVDVASGILVVVSATVGVQRFRLSGLPTFREAHNQLRSSIHVLHRANEGLAGTVDRLTQHTVHLQHVETDLDAAARKSGAQVDRLLEIVNANGELQKKIRKGLQNQVIQQIMTAVLSTDKDRNFIMGPNEVAELTVRLEHLPGVVFNKPAFLARIASDKGDLTLTDVLDMVRTMDQDLVDKETAIFCFQVRQLRSLPKAG
jgi:hypothetical protein